MKLICGKCRKKINSENSDFCPKCGASLSLASEIPEKEDLRSLDEEEKAKKQVMSAVIGFLASIALIILKELFGW